MKKLLTFFSPSHRVLYEEYFLPSFQEYLSGAYELHAKEIAQVSPSGEFASLGWDRVMLEKLDFIVGSIDVTSGEPLVFSDCDVQFFASLSYELEGFDILFQQDFYEKNVCAGFFIARQSPRVCDFLVHARDILRSRLDTGSEDQTIINELLQKIPSVINAGMLPKEKYWTVGNATGGRLWDGADFECPRDIIMHHANFTMGVERKVALLKKVKEKQHV